MLLTSLCRRFVDTIHNFLDSVESKSLSACQLNGCSLKGYIFSATTDLFTRLPEDAPTTGIMARTGKRRAVSTFCLERSDLSSSSTRRTRPTPKPKPAADPATAKSCLLGNDGLSGRLAGSRTWNCSPC